MLRIMSLSSLVIFLICSVAFSQDSVMGDWKGSYSTEYGDTGVLQAQVIAEGRGNYRAFIRVGYEGPRVEITGHKQDNKTIFTSKVDVGYELGGVYDVTAEIVDSKFTGRFKGAEYSGSIKLHKLENKSPTLGAEPPEGTIVLFDGSSLEAWQQLNGKPAKWKILKDGSVKVTKANIITKQTFNDQQIHVEFRTPFIPKARDQKRGNSGVYIQGRYEVQVLDSYGLEPADNLCGAIYGIAAPRVNACFPPMVWQTYDITFYAPKFDEAGNKIKPAEMTVKHNGILIHEKVKIDGVTRACADSNAIKPGGLMLQDHGNPVQYRNIWILPL